MLCVDLTYIANPYSGMRVDLWGENLSAKEVAQSASTIVYELLGGLTKRAPYIYSSLELVKIASYKITHNKAIGHKTAWQSPNLGAPLFKVCRSFGKQSKPSLSALPIQPLVNFEWAKFTESFSAPSYPKSKRLFRRKHSNSAYRLI